MEMKTVALIGAGAVGCYFVAGLKEKSGENLWDFKDEANPKIHVRTWQPYEATPEKEVFGLNSFNVSKL